MNILSIKKKGAKRVAQISTQIMYEKIESGVPIEDYGPGDGKERNDGEIMSVERFGENLKRGNVVKGRMPTSQMERCPTDKKK